MKQALFAALLFILTASAQAQQIKLDTCYKQLIPSTATLQGQFLIDSSIMNKFIMQPALPAKPICCNCCHQLREDLIQLAEKLFLTRMELLEFKMARNKKSSQ